MRLQCARRRTEILRVQKSILDGSGGQPPQSRDLIGNQVVGPRVRGLWVTVEEPSLRKREESASRAFESESQTQKRIRAVVQLLRMQRRPRRSS